MTVKKEIKARSALWVATFVFVVMSGLAFNIIANDGFDHGVGNDNFNVGFSDPWQVFIHVDLMTGLVLMVAWMLFRECGGSINHKVAWAWLFLW